jgi:hypothetical protein
LAGIGVITEDVVRALAGFDLLRASKEAAPTLSAALVTFTFFLTTLCDVDGGGRIRALWKRGAPGTVRVAVGIAMRTVKATARAVLEDLLFLFGIAYEQCLAVLRA